MPISGPPLDGSVRLPEILKAGLETKPDADALVSRRQRWTWRGLDEVSTRLAVRYLGLGLKPKDRVASLMPNRTELLVHYVACMKCGLDAMPLNATGKVDRVTLKKMAGESASATGSAIRP